MTPTSPTWGDVERFLQSDRWQQFPATRRGGRRQSHIFFEKLLPDGRLLATHISQDRSARISAGRFGEILRSQLEVARDDFWDAIRAGSEVDRPVEVEEIESIEHPFWVVSVLVSELHMSADGLASLSRDQAERLVHEFWARPKDP